MNKQSKDKIEQHRIRQRVRCTCGDTCILPGLLSSTTANLIRQGYQQKTDQHGTYWFKTEFKKECTCRDQANYKTAVHG